MFRLWMKFVVGICFIVTVSGCGVFSMESPQFPTLPGRITVILPGSPMAGPYTYAEYVNGMGLVPLSDEANIPQPDRASRPHRDPSTSPDGIWRIRDHPTKNRRIVTNGLQTYEFEFWTFSFGEIDWSPDSRYIVYRADEDHTKWLARIMVMDLQNEGKTIWIGNGELPRWDAR